jgi:hypothetical protein
VALSCICSWCLVSRVRSPLQLLRYASILRSEEGDKLLGYVLTSFECRVHCRIMSVKESQWEFTLSTFHVTSG